jgi:hypothetical protein
MEFRKDYFLIILLRIVRTFDVKFKESVEEYLAGLYVELFTCIAACYLDVRLEYLCICHL